MSKWTKHSKKWKYCKKCSLKDKRHHTVLFKGSLPCDVLFVGEAPGASEDMLGKPFVGPAGKLLDKIIGQALDGQYSCGFTNLVCCIPIGEDGKKIEAPPDKCIGACKDRLQELIQIANPKCIIGVGKLAYKHLVQCDGQIDHPAFLLRLDVSQKAFMIQRNTVALEDIVFSLLDAPF